MEQDHHRLRVAPLTRPEEWRVSTAVQGIHTGPMLGREELELQQYRISRHLNNYIEGMVSCKLAMILEYNYMYMMGVCLQL